MMRTMKASLRTLLLLSTILVSGIAVEGRGLRDYDGGHGGYNDVEIPPMLYHRLSDWHDSREVQAAKLACVVERCCHENFDDNKECGCAWKNVNWIRKMWTSYCGKMKLFVDDMDAKCQEEDDEE